jgi:hypothetical protein
MPLPEQVAAQHVACSFPQRTTQDCYQAFPIEVKASCPLGTSKSLNFETTSERLAAGPFSGARCRPPPAESKAAERVQREDEMQRNRRLVLARHADSAPK